VRPIAAIECNDGMKLLPANKSFKDDIVSAMDESGNAIFNAMPWLEIQKPILEQIEDYLTDVQRYGAAGLSYHWSINIDDEFVGLIALDHTPQLTLGHWNLGYWVRLNAQKKGIASKAIDAVLGWIGRGGLTSVEISVNPENIAGVRTAEGAVSRWNGYVLHTQKEVELAGSIVMHDCWLIPRLPLEGNR
tara:strand:+ start:791 stop:1360 length:570 start_codon:yes stop_codon:yes gene_type:complete